MISRRRFLTWGATASAAALAPPVPAAATAGQARTARIRPGGDDAGFDPWMEIIAPNFRHNATEVSRIAGGRPILAVVKNNAYGMGDALVGPLLASCREVAGIACVRPAEALAMRAAGVRKPILTMAELGEEESVDLVRRDVTLSCWLDEAPARLAHIARRARRRVGVHLYLDAGMNREGMPVARALPWMEAIAADRNVRIDGTYHMFVHNLEFNRVQQARFLETVAAARTAGLAPGRLHAAATYELHRYPDAHLDMVRVGNALFGARPGGDVESDADLRPVFRLKARVNRVERLDPGDSAGFGRAFMPERATRVALLPVGHTDGYPTSAGGACEVLIGGRLYPVVGGVMSAHVLVDVGLDSPVGIGDTATLIGPDDEAILPHEVATRSNVGFYQMITKMSALLPRRVVEA
jgi:alanine racemase